MDLILECRNAAKLSAGGLSASRLSELSNSFMKLQPQHIQNKYTENLAVFDRQKIHIGSANWYFIHYFGFCYTATSILVFVTDTNRYLLQRRASTVSWPNLLDCSAGGCCPSIVTTENDRIKHAAQELAEELFDNSHHFANLVLTKLCHVFSAHEIQCSDGYFYKNHFIHYYYHEITSREQRKLTHNNEVKYLVYLTKSEILATAREEMAPGLLNAVNSNIL